MSGTIKTVFPGNNSSRGFFSYYESGLAPAERIYILKGGPGTGKSTLMRRLAEHFSEEGFDVELWQCSSDNHSLDGVFLPAWKVAVVDGTSPHVVEPRYPGVREEIVSLGEFWREDILKGNREEIMALTDDISAAFREAYRHLAAAGAADEALLAARREDSGALAALEGFLGEALGEEPWKVRHFFGAAVTPEGVVDLTLSLCQSVKRRWFLEGKRGLGQQLYFEALLARAERKGLAAEVYHGFLDPEEIVAVIFPEKSLGVAAAERVPAELRREGDHILSFDGAEDGVQEKNAEKQREDALAAAVAGIRRAHILHDKLEAYYISAMNFEKIDEIEKKITQKITKRV